MPEGSLFGPIDIWHRHRKILDPFFGAQKLKVLLPLFDEKSKKLTEMMKKHVNQGEIDIFFNMAALTLETVLSAMEFEVDLQNMDQKVRDSTIKNLEQ
jgi:cytochrome P450